MKFPRCINGTAALCSRTGHIGPVPKGRWRLSWTNRHYGRNLRSLIRTKPETPIKWMEASRFSLSKESTAVDQVVACAPVTQRARVRSPVGTTFLGEVFRDFSSPVRQMSGRFRSPRSPNIIWLSSSILIHYGRQWPEMLTRPKASNIQIFVQRKCAIHNVLWRLCSESGFSGFNDKCETSLRVVGGSNLSFNVIFKWKTTLILSRILAIFLPFYEILNIRDKNEIFCFFLTIFTFISQLLVELRRKRK